MLDDEWLRLSAYASLVHLVGDGDLLDAWQPIVDHLDEL